MWYIHRLSFGWCAHLVSWCFQSGITGEKGKESIQNTVLFFLCLKVSYYLLILMTISLDTYGPVEHWWHLLRVHSLDISSIMNHEAQFLINFDMDCCYLVGLLCLLTAFFEAVKWCLWFPVTYLPHAVQEMMLGVISEFTYLTYYIFTSAPHAWMHLYVSSLQFMQGTSWWYLTVAPSPWSFKIIIYIRKLETCTFYLPINFPIACCSI